MAKPRCLSGKNSQQIPTVKNLPRETNNKTEPCEQRRLLGHGAGCRSFCPAAPCITARSQVLASTALSRTKMEFSFQVLLVGRAATSTRMAYSPLHPDHPVSKSWGLVGYLDRKMIYPKNPAMPDPPDGRRGTSPENST